MTSQRAPERGFVHRSELLRRGWTGALLETLAGADVVRVVVAAPGASQKAYRASDVERVEREDLRVRRALADRASLVPRWGPYTEDDTLTVDQLTARGWTHQDTQRLLGDPDVYPERINGARLSGGGVRWHTVQYEGQWGRDRVDFAETRDPGLRERLGRRAEARERKIGARVDGGDVIYRQRAGRWVLVGYDLTPGERVTVTRRDGQTDQVVVGAILATDHEGRRTAAIAQSRRT